MKKVFEHLDFSRVGHFQTVLEEAGIPTALKNQYASTAAGEIPMTEVWPELWVVNDADFERAEEVLRAFREEVSNDQSKSAWTCPACGENVDGNFGECWNCQAERPVTNEQG